VRKRAYRVLMDWLLGVPAKIVLLGYDHAQATAGNRRQDD
jgi:hypothetical protein